MKGLIGVQIPDSALNGHTLRIRICVRDPQGFHMRPCAAFAEKAGQFNCTITVCVEDRRVNGKSGVELMTLFAPQGTEMMLETSGIQAREALEQLLHWLTTSGYAEAVEPSLQR